MWLAALLVLAAGPVSFEGCQDALLDQALTRGLLGEHPGPAFAVRCVGPDEVAVSSGPVTRTITLPAGTAALRARTVAFVLLELAAGRAPWGHDAGAAPTARAATTSSREGPASTGQALRGSALAGAPPQSATKGSDGGSAPTADAALPGAQPQSTGRDANPAAQPPVATGTPPAATPGVQPAAAQPTTQAPAQPLTAQGPQSSSVAFGEGPREPAGRATPVKSDAPVRAAREDGAGAGDGRSEGPRDDVNDGAPHGSPVELALLPWVGLNAWVGMPARNHFVLGVLAARSTWLDGVGLGLSSFVDRDVRGLQLAGVVAWAGGDVTGAQLSTGVSWTAGHMRGLQVGVTSFGGPVDGLQVGLLNVGGDVTGVQLGVLNIARTVKGAQLGLVNVARSSSAPVGVVNLIDDTPLRFSFAVGDWAMLAINTKFGGEHLYTFVTVAWTPFSTFRVGGGLGTHLGRGHGWYLEVELSAQSLWSTDVPDSWAKQVAFLGEVNVGYQLADRFALFAGTGAQVVLSPSGSGFSIFGIPLGPTTAVDPMLVFGVQL